MIKRLAVFTLFLLPLLLSAQDFSALWQGHFSYNTIKDVVKGNNKIYAASDNAIFSLDLQTNELSTLTTVNGLSGETISTIYYSDVYKLLLIGYENGLIEIAFDDDDDILSVVDIIEKPTIPPTSKKINHFKDYNNVVYVSTNYGVSVFNMERLEFGDTYFIGGSGGQTRVNQTAILGDYIYAACVDGNGLKKAQITSPNLIDYQNWQTVTNGDFLAVETVENSLYALRTNSRMYRVVNDVLTEVFQFPNMPVDVKAVSDRLLVTTQNSVYMYDSGFNALAQADVNSTFNTAFTSAVFHLDSMYIGTKDFGVLKTSVSNPTEYEEIHPEGPLLNIPFSIQSGENELWVTFGEYDLFYNPYGLNSRGISYFKDDSWINTPYEDVLDAKCLSTISINPSNNNQVFIGSFFSGLLEVNDGIPTTLYNETNSGLESLVLPSNPNYVDIRVGATVFDKNGVLWTLTSQVENALKSFNPSNNQWQSYSFKKFRTELGYPKIVIGNDNTKWIAGYWNGVIGFNENNGTPLLKNINSEESNMPAHNVRAIAIDKRNQLWVGTERGLRVIYNTSNFFTEENIRAEEIIIEEGGIAKELLFEQNITDIEVDGSNNKWIGTTDSGLFYFSADGQKTIFHFTKTNSPLPSNTINDVSLDPSNGIVYIATNKGLVSFQSGGSSPLNDLESAYAYPNPVRPTFNIVDEKVKIKDISENVNIKITDIEGNLVAEAQSRNNLRYSGYNLEIDGGTAYWNGKNLANNVVASGVYLVMLSDLDTFETKVLKLMVVR
ncbi:two-component regulator propeller domain-containing protein [Hwangdonia lutea]|uniref:Two-component regulator propeller domain-containing protein n=1 Tax=Hwangdonia lutea TaxID=3075823 RepID=A0AA97ER04_9FLAO|nr:two-component regulator propeller domain-containing protein [Hwangdonia sp. SCSIO 19198]WOD44900.1 two-component regulator propeller domain-containing protein [Hwangdonia sp. SCSIO 19198]